MAMEPGKYTDQDILNELLERRVDVLKLIQIRTEPEPCLKIELKDAWCPMRRKRTMIIYFAASDEELQEELMSINERINHYLEKTPIDAWTDLLNKNLDMKPNQTNTKKKKEMTWTEFFVYGSLTIGVAILIAFGLSYLLQVAVDGNKKVEMRIEVSSKNNN